MGLRLIYVYFFTLITLLLGSVNAMASKTISVIGDLDYDLIMLADRIPESGETLAASRYQEALGGKGANAAIATYRACHARHLDLRVVDKISNPERDDCNRSGNTENDEKHMEFNVKMVGAIGNDRYGEKLHHALVENGVDVSGVVTIPACRTSICFVMLEQHTGENRCLFTPGATASWTQEDFRTPEQLGRGVRPDLCVAQMEIDPPVVQQMIETAGRAGIDFVLNAAPAYPVRLEVMQWITHLLVNESEAAVMSGRQRSEVTPDSWNTICQEFLARGVRNVVITLGSMGAYYVNATQNGHALAYKVDVVDSTGAGDVFTGVYAAEYLRQQRQGQWDIERAVVRANKAAAIAVTKLGAQAAIPWSDEIGHFQAPYNTPAL